MSSYSVERIGHEGEPVVVVDGFHPDPDALRAQAARAGFKRLSPHYPGVQAPADPAHLAPVGDTLTQIIHDVFGVQAGVSVVQCTFSLVTVPDAELAPIQRLPHVDTTDPGRIALLHYLSGDDMGGTAFYRHRATGLDVLTPETFPRYRDAVQNEGLPPAHYMRGSDARFEMIHCVEARPNRAVLYRSRLLHSGMIPEGAGFSAEPESGRLTLNTFFQSKD